MDLAKAERDEVIRERLRKLWRLKRGASGAASGAELARLARAVCDAAVVLFPDQCFIPGLLREELVIAWRPREVRPEPAPWTRLAVLHPEEAEALRAESEPAGKGKRR